LQSEFEIVSAVGTRATAQGGSVMKLIRREFLRLTAATVAASALPTFARAQTYPTRAVRLISGFPAGGPNDVLARLIGQALSERLGQPFVIENRPGAGGNIGTEAVARAAPDGYTLLLVGPTNTINATLYARPHFDFLRDIVPVAGISREASVIVVHPSFPTKTLPEFIGYAKANPGKINMASAGNGAASHVSGELFKMMAGVDIVHVPYRGGAPALTDLLGGQVQVFFAPVAASIEYVRDGRLRALAVSAATRLETLPGIPTVGDFVPGYEATSLYGVGAPRNTPAKIIDKLNNEVNAALADPRTNARLSDFGGTPTAMTPAAFGKLIAEETEKWGKVVRFAGLKPE
jgi:tripartite-type tricarboxylate transporter receptor subunit TctC